MWKILQQPNPDDFVIATGKQYSIKQFIEYTAKQLKMRIIWRGKGLKEKGFYKSKCIIECDKNYLRPLDVNTLLGDASKARKTLNWKPRIDIHKLIEEMINVEFKNLDATN